MIRRSQLIEELNKFPADALVHAYEGEIACIAVVAAGKDDRSGVHFPLGYTVADKIDRAFVGHVVLYSQDEQ